MERKLKHLEMIQGIYSGNGSHAKRASAAGVSRASTQSFQRPFKDESIGNVFVALGSLGTDQSFEIDGSYRYAFKINGLCILFQHLECFSAGSEHDVDHESICHADIFALLEPPKNSTSACRSGMQLRDQTLSGYSVRDGKRRLST